MSNARVLLSMPYGRRPPVYGRYEAVSFEETRFSRGCDLFGFRGHAHQSWAHALAQNIKAPSRYLEVTSRERFVRELCTGGYTHLGLSGFPTDVGRILEMARLARDLRPELTIMVGGYAAMAIRTLFSPEEYRRDFEHVIVGEGIGALRRILGEPADGPTFVDHLPLWAHVPQAWAHPAETAAGGVVIASLGCPIGCDFCATTFQFGRKLIHLQTAEAVGDEIARLVVEENVAQVYVTEEDSFIHKPFLRTMTDRARRKLGAAFARVNLYVLGSVSSLSRWDLDELLEMGVGEVFIGVESKFGREHGYGKLTNTREVVDGLHARGINTTLSCVMGFDFHDPSTLEEDLAWYISLRPVHRQMTMLVPYPGTELFDRRRDILLDERDWHSYNSLESRGKQYRHFTGCELGAFLDLAYQRVYAAVGAPMLRWLRVAVDGMGHLARMTRGDARFHRSENHRHFMLLYGPFLRSMAEFAPSTQVREEALALIDPVKSYIGADQSLDRLSLIVLRRAERERNRMARGLAPEPRPRVRHLSYDYSPGLPKTITGRRRYEKTIEWGDGSDEPLAPSNHIESRTEEPCAPMAGAQSVMS